MNKKGFSILASLLIILSLLIVSLPEVLAKHDIVTIPETIEEIGPDSLLNVTIKCGDGEIQYVWSIIDYNIDKNHFYIEDENGDELGEPHNLWNRNSSSGKVSVKEGKYIINWKNNNINQSFFLKYSIEYPKYKEEESKGCYSSVLALSILLFVMVISVAGVFKKMK